MAEQEKCPGCGVRLETRLIPEPMRAFGPATYTAGTDERHYPGACEMASLRRRLSVAEAQKCMVIENLKRMEKEEHLAADEARTMGYIGDGDYRAGKAAGLLAASRVLGGGA